MHLNLQKIGQVMIQMGDDWVKIKLVQVDLTDNLFLSNSLFKKYKLKKRIKNFISNIEEEERKRIASETIDFSQPFNEQSMTRSSL